MTAPPTRPAAQPSAQPRRRRTHPPTEYWDVFTATWRTRSPVVPAPRRGD